MIMKKKRSSYVVIGDPETGKFLLFPPKACGNNKKKRM
jgi:hypothetical protein